MSEAPVEPPAKRLKVENEEVPHIARSPSTSSLDGFQVSGDAGDVLLKSLAHPEYSVGQRVVYTPSRGRGWLATVRYVGAHAGKAIVGIETDEDGLLFNDGTHPKSGEQLFQCPDHRGCFVSAHSSRLRIVSEEAQRKWGSEQTLSRLLQGLEAMSESQTLRLARTQRQAESTMRSHGSQQPEFRKVWHAPSQQYRYIPRGESAASSRVSVPADAVISSIEGGPEATERAMAPSSSTASSSSRLLPNLLEGQVSLEDAKAVYEHCASKWTEPLPANKLLALVRAARDVIVKESSVLRLSVPLAGKLVVVGDTHGHLKDLVYIWQREGVPAPDNVFLFNGDICDRGDSAELGGQQALHIWASVLSFKLACMESIFVTRGNHEDGSYWPEYGLNGFSAEIEAKYDRVEAHQLIDAFTDLCESLPLAATIDRTCLVVHGGLPRCWMGRGAARLEEISAIKRPVAMPDVPDKRVNQMIYDLAWADPQAATGIGSNSRGDQVIGFGPDVTLAFLKAEGLRLLIRSHEVPGRQAKYVGRGFEWWHPLKALLNESAPSISSQEGLCVTVFSASDYCGVEGGNKASHAVFAGAVEKMELVEHQGSEAAKTLLELKAKLQEVPMARVPSPSPEEQRLISQGWLHRSLIEAIVQHKHEMLAEFLAMDKQRLWYLPPDDWVTCCHRVLPLIPWEAYVEDPTIVPLQEGMVRYTSFLTRYQIRFHNKMGLHAGFRRRLTMQLFEGLLQANYTLRELVDAVDIDGDGVVSMTEFANALARFAKVLPEAQAQALYRTTIGHRGLVQVDDFLGRLSLQFAFENPRLTDEQTKFVPEKLDLICREIFDAAGSTGKKGPTLAAVLRDFFVKADKDGNGYLESAEIIEALRPLRSCAGLSDEQLRAIVRYIDLNDDNRINYAELLSALCVRASTSGSSSADVGDDIAASSGPEALLEDMLEAVHRVLHFEYAKPLRAMLRRLSPPGSSRCSPAFFAQALKAMNGSTGEELMSQEQIMCLADTLDTSQVEGENSPRFDFEDYLSSFEVVDTFADETERDVR